MKKRKDFTFKKFVIAQEKVAMPVTTDACIFGAFAAFNNGDNILDIGAGTGVLSLMLAQRYPLSAITAIEIDEESYLCCKNNFSNSTFKYRLEIENIAIENFVADRKFGGLIWNPPFFENQLNALHPPKNLARHTGELRYGAMPEIIDRFLADNGRAWVLVPQLHKTMFLQLCLKQGFSVKSLVSIQANEGKPAHLWMVELVKTACVLHTQAIVTYTQAGDYTNELKKLLQDFYVGL
jgi:tRNA1Val (adenine37-N6)-methyltransferase